MAFGIKRAELECWKREVEAGNIAFLTHYWIDERFPGCSTVTKVGCCDLEKLKIWGRQYGLQPEWLDLRGNYPHFDLFGDRQKSILKAENLLEQVERLEKK
ncbi:hypothetical protein M4S82_07910 [Planococcus sp. MERTA32b]|nr:hypothetical protein [Planococcus sp. MER TA 32b]